MDSIINEKLQDLLKDPEAIRTAMNLVSNLTKKEEPGDESEPVDDNGTAEDITSVLPASRHEVVPTMREDDRIRLLRSLKPFLDQGKQKKIDSLVMALGAANLISSYKNDDMLKQLGKIFGL